MKSTVEKRVFNNYTIGLLGFIISFLQTIVTVPVLLNYWGNDTYGIWLALFAGFTLLQIFDFGHQVYVGNLLNIEYHVNKDKFKEYLGSSLSIAIFLGLLQITLTLFLVFTGYLNNFLGVSNESLSYSVISYSMISLMTMWVLAGSVGGILVKILIPAGYMAQSLVWGIIFKLAQFLSLIIVAMSGGQILEASIVYSIVQLILSYVVFRYIKNKLPEFYPWWKVSNIKTGLANFKKSAVLTINNGLQQLSNNGVILFITNMFTTAIVPAFTTVRTLTNTATVFTNLFITSIQPDVIKYHAKQEFEKLQATLNANWFFSGMVINTGIILLIPFAGKIFEFWTGGMINFDFKLFMALTASISMINFGAGLFNYLLGINYLHAITLISVSRVIILFSFAFIFSPEFGLYGIGISVLISEVFSSLILPFYFVNKIINKFGGKLDMKNAVTALSALIVILLLFLLLLLGYEFSYVIWGLALLITAFIYIHNWSLLDIEIKIRFISLFRSLLSRSK